MRIGIDISQIVFEGTGVSRYMQALIRALLKEDKKNEYILFACSLRQKVKFYQYVESLGNSRRVQLKVFSIPPVLLDLLWNRFHIMPVERLIGPVDVFWSSDWTQPPLLAARGVTTIHDLSFLLFPRESHNTAEMRWLKLGFSANIAETQKRRLKWVKRECSRIFCDSEATKKDVQKLLGIEESKLRVVYPGF